jgi:ribosomal protein S12 methylthiotransferase accessory factor
MPRAPRPLRDGSLAERLGVTRVARLTGLDRTGVEVASAVRPGAHVLQVTNGKGATFEGAMAGALFEAAELWAAEHAWMDVWDDAAALVDRYGADAVVSPEALAPDRAEPGWAGLRLAWRVGQDLLGGAQALVPACAVHCPPAGGPLLGPAVIPWTSNGMGAHDDRASALLHALLETAERDLLSRALPEGFTKEAIASRLLDPGSLASAAPRAAALAAGIGRRGFGVHLLDASAAAATEATGSVNQSPDRARRTRREQREARRPSIPVGDVREEQRRDATRIGRRGDGRKLFHGPPALPCAAAVIVDHALGPVPVSAGYACRLDRDEALLAALLEAAQSRATEIHGAREDVLVGDRHAAAGLAALLEAARPRRKAASMPGGRTSRGEVARSAAAGVRAVLERLRHAGVSRAVAIELEGPPGVHVVKVLVPGLALSELL